MKIDLNKVDTENFILRPVMIAGEECTLIFPNHIGCKWTKQNLHFRSSIWNSKGELISASFKKFFNWGEQPDLCYTPFSLTANGGCQILEKLDGSTLIVSKYKGELIVRTRGTADASIMENAHELELLKAKYPKAFDFEGETSDVSRIFEWESPENRIVLKHDEADIKLTGVIYHGDYTMASQTELDIFAELLEVPRPRWYEFDSIKEMQAAVEAFKGVEGVCVYCNKGQDIRKLKGVEYLKLHHLKSELASFEKLLDLYLELGCPGYNGFFKYIEDAFDYEIADHKRGDISKLCDLDKHVKNVVQGMEKFVDKVKTLPTRKDQALYIQQAYGDSGRTGMVFSLLDDKPLDKVALKKLFYQKIK